MADERALPPPSLAPPSPVLRLLGATRFLLLIAIAAIFATAMAMLAYGAAETWALLRQLAAVDGAPMPKQEAMLASIKLVDLFLIVTILYVAAVGLFELFVDVRLPVPPWLRIRGIDDLKQKLVEMIITVLGVEFLGHVVAWNGDQNLMPLGIGIAVVVVALTWFLGLRPGQKK